MIGNYPYNCIHWKNNPLKKCTGRIWKDETGKEWERCQEHICVFCHENVKSKNKKQKQVGQNNQGPLYFCNNKKECIDKREKIKIENGKIRSKLINNRDPLFDQLKADSLIDSEFLTKLHPFFNDLWEKQTYLLDNNYFEVPAFTADMLETIRGLIEGASFLTDHEKNDLKLAYTKSGGNIDSIINKVEETLTNIGKMRKTRKEHSEFLHQLENLDGWNLLDSTQKQYYFDQAAKSDGLHFNTIMSQAQEEIKKIPRERERERERERQEPKSPEPPTRKKWPWPIWSQLSFS